MKGLPEAGWAFSSAYHGKGYAREALDGCLTWADRSARFPLTTCLIEASNTPSIRLAEAGGFRRMQSIDNGSGGMIDLYERHRLASRKKPSRKAPGHSELSQQRADVQPNILPAILATWAPWNLAASSSISDG